MGFIPTTKVFNYTHTFFLLPPNFFLLCNVLYPLEEYYRYGFIREGIWVDINEEIKDKKNILNSKYVTITAKFSALEHGHGDLFIGTLKEIEKVELITPRRD